MEQNMKILLVAVNAKFIHTNLAVRSLAAYASKNNIEAECLEFTVNNDEDNILSNIYGHRPDVLCFSCYLWNIGIVLRLTKLIKLLIPDIKIVLGGPEVSFDAPSLMEKNTEIDFCIAGEGEVPFVQLAHRFINRDYDYENIKGICYRNNSGEVTNITYGGFIDLNTIPFVYTKHDIEQQKDKILYYETSRGCPFNCQYCLSAGDSVRFLDFERIKSDIDFFLKNKVRQVKLVDRTFNCKADHAIKIWKYIIENDNGITNFHFEIEARLQNDNMIQLLKEARPGLFQFEIGVQSTNLKTLEAIERKSGFDKIAGAVNQLRRLNINLHLDLIAGLPFEDYNSFKKSFNDVYSLKPDQLQLGFLKLLKGSGLRNTAKQYGIVYRQYPPYEVLYTDAISYGELVKLKRIEELVEIYYNSGKSLSLLKYMTGFLDSFSFFESFMNYWQSNNYFSFEHNRYKLYEYLYMFCCNTLPDKTEIITQLTKFDMYVNENVKNPPSWLSEATLSDTGGNFITKQHRREFYEDKENFGKYFSEMEDSTPRVLNKISHIELFSVDVLDFALGTDNEIKPMPTTILFNYSQHGGVFKNCGIYKITL